MGCKVRSWGPVGETFDVWGLKIGWFWVTKCDPGGLLENVVRVMGPKMLILGISMAKISKFFSVWRFGGHLDCKVRSWGLWERFLMSGGSKLEATK